MSSTARNLDETPVPARRSRGNEYVSVAHREPSSIAGLVLANWCDACREPYGSKAAHRCARIPRGASDDEYRDNQAAGAHRWMPRGDRPNGFRWS